MLAEAILRGEVDNELSEIVKAAIARSGTTGVTLTDGRYKHASLDLEAQLLHILAEKRKMEAEGHPVSSSVLVAAAALQTLQENLGRYLSGVIE